MVWFFFLRGYIISHINEMNFKSIKNRRDKNYNYYIKMPMQMVEFKLNVIIAKDLHLINSLHRTFNHSLFRKYSNIPYNFQE